MAGVIVDLQATQSIDHRDRGIARYAAELALAVEDLRPRFVQQFTLNPGLPPPGSLDALVATGRMSAAPPQVPDEPGLLHLLSPVELAVGLDRLWPPHLRRAQLPLVVTLYDLIPLVFPEHYLEDPGRRSRYHARLELVKAADRVLAISECTRRDAIERLGLDPARVIVVGAGTGPQFVPPGDRDAAAVAAQRCVAGLRGRYVLYTGGIEHRKNLDRLVSCWPLVPAAIRAGRQLVIVCRPNEPDRHHYRTMAEALGVGDEVLLTGYVAEDALVRLYQGTDLFVFPSLYEGFGLPVAEAQACGAPVVAAHSSSLVELVDDEATFDPLDPAAMAAAVARALTDTDVRARLLRRSGPTVVPPSWRDVARRTVEAYDELVEATSRRPPRARRRPLVAVVTPLPPELSGVSPFSTHLLPELSRHCDIDAFVQGPASEAVAPDGVGVHNVLRLELVEAAQGGYHAVLYQLGNSEFHGGALAALRRRRGVVLAHEVRLTDLYALAAWLPAAAPGGFAATVRRLYPSARVDLDGDHRLDPGISARAGLTMAREIVTLAERFLTTSTFAAHLARVDADPAHHHRIAQVPFAVFAPAGAPPGVAADRDTDLVVSVGVVHEVKQPAKLLRAFAVLRKEWPATRLVFVGPTSEALAERLQGLAAHLGVAEAFEITGWVDDATYASWLARATLAVQLREVTNGESSGAVGNCFSMGLPVVVSSLGAARELPDGAAVRVGVDVTAEALAGVLGGLLADTERRWRIGEAALAYAEAHSFAGLADRLAEVLLG